VFFYLSSCARRFGCLLGKVVVERCDVGSWVLGHLWRGGGELEDGLLGAGEEFRLGCLLGETEFVASKSSRTEAVSAAVGMRVRSEQ